MLGLYVHIPFCSAICNYCNFNRGLFDADLKQRYIGALLAEIASKGDGSGADTIFFGGGTPSLLEPAEVQSVIDACRVSFDVTTDAEVTLEANPETVTHERLRAFRAAGVNRLSFGVQSFRDDELRRLSRLHSAARAREAFEMARDAGFDNVSLDLMMWLPQQSVVEWLTSVDSLIALGPDHASLYLLEIYPNAPLRDTMARSKWSLAPDDDAAEMYLGAMSRLDDAGYVQYEISNVSRPGLESRHNLKYWTDGEWLGFGCGAHTTRRGVREKNVAATEDYISAVRTGRPVGTERRVLSVQERFEEAVFTGLRLSHGVSVDAVRSRYGVDVWEQYGEELRPFVDQHLLIYDGGALRLTREGMLLANEVMTVFIGPPVR
ncbi:MAG TPA: radical SAM family heme chaperone HemW [Vicinamibacterales bacterium]|nr:radical SAM family heme chaperone HemW [Vicinamibacterales bacterium]